MAKFSNVTALRWMQQLMDMPIDQGLSGQAYLGGHGDHDESAL